MKIKNRITAGFVAVVMVILTAAGMKFNTESAKAAALSETVNNIKWHYTAVKGDETSNAVNVYLYGGDYEAELTEDIVIPEYFTDSDGARHYVESIGDTIVNSDSFFEEIELQKAGISVDASNCSKLTTVNDYVMYNESSKLNTVKLPKTVNYIGVNVFGGTTNDLTIECENPNIEFGDETDITNSKTKFKGTVIKVPKNRLKVYKTLIRKKSTGWQKPIRIVGM